MTLFLAAGTLRCTALANDHSNGDDFGSFPPAVIAAWRGPGAPRLRAPHRLQSAGALGRAGGAWDGRVGGPRPGAAAPAAARVPSKQSGSPCVPPALQSRYGCHSQTPAV